ncbi:hypothetical protein B0H13DRAFT_2370630 [Mycena leptocephala]|nr:hypothetical protein B0H13DRAFT_2370630 [Mycena leptocephala]
MSSTGSSSPPPADDSDDDNYQNLMSTAMLVTTPNQNTRKRNTDHLGDAKDSLPLPSLELSLVCTNGNHLRAITSFAAQKRLCPEQLTTVEAFARDPLPVRLGKLYATCLANENTLAKFQAAKPQCEINREFAVEPPSATRWLIRHAVLGGYVIWWPFSCLLVMAYIKCLLPY